MSKEQIETLIKEALAKEGLDLKDIDLKLLGFDLSSLEKILGDGGDRYDPSRALARLLKSLADYLKSVLPDDEARKRYYRYLILHSIAAVEDNNFQMKMLIVGKNPDLAKQVEVILKPHIDKVVDFVYHEMWAMRQDFFEFFREMDDTKTQVTAR